MSNKTLIEWNADVGTRFLTIHPDGSFDIDKDAPPLFVIGELAKAFIRQQDRIQRLEEALEECDWAFTKFCPEHESRYGDAWEKVRDALNRPNPFKPYWPEENE